MTSNVEWDHLYNEAHPWIIRYCQWQVTFVVVFMTCVYYMFCNPFCMQRFQCLNVGLTGDRLCVRSFSSDASKLNTTMCEKLLLVGPIYY